MLDQHFLGGIMFRAYVMAGLGCFVLSANFSAYAAEASKIGCPQFHCKPESTGVMYQPIAENPPPSKVAFQNRTAGTYQAQGCSGNGPLLASLIA
jgi:hypothetical protein